VPSHVFVLTAWAGGWPGGYTEVFWKLESAQRFSGVTKWRKHGDRWLADGTDYHYKIRRLRVRGAKP
jgi:hypothetical protein